MFLYVMHQFGIVLVVLCQTFFDGQHYSFFSTTLATKPHFLLNGHGNRFGTVLDAIIIEYSIYIPT